jgi:hypothetical protein
MVSMMYRPLTCVWVALTVLATAGATTASAQLVPTLKNPRLSLGVSSGAPEADTEMFLKLAAPAGVAIGRVEATVVFPAAIEFQEITGAALTQKTVKAETKVSDVVDGRRTLTLALQPETAGQPLPREVNLNLVLKVVKDTPPGVLDVNLQAKAFTPANEPIGSLEVYNGRINIQAPETFFACFFYMH